MRFRLASRSMTLDDLEHDISSNFRRILRDFADLWRNNGWTNLDSDRVATR